jgi:hypothetical protein
MASRKQNKIPKSQIPEIVLNPNGRTNPAPQVMTIPRNPFMAPKTRRGSRQNLMRAGLLTVGGQNYSPISYSTGSYAGSISSNGNVMIVERTEPILTVASVANAFNVQAINFHVMQPNLTWLTNMANSFTTYEVLRAEFTYVPLVPTTTAGGVTMAFAEDMRDDTPTTQSQMLAYEQGLMAPVYAGGEGGRYLQRFGSPGGNVVSFELPGHVIKDAAGVPKRFRVTKNTNLNAALTGTDAAVYSVEAYCPGRLLVATDGVAAANASVGQVFVRYKIRLSGSINIALQQ